MEGSFVRWVPLIAYLLLIGISAGRTVWHWTKTDINPYVLINDDSAEGYVGRSLRWLTTALLLVLVAHAAGWDSNMGRLPWAQAATAHWLGVALVVAALCWSTIGQTHMGNAWRIGIDHQRATQLIRHGVFVISRNPIFLGMRVALLGMVLLVPNAVALAIALATDILIQLQTRLEETHLLARHGDEYRAYTQRVHRWLGYRAAGRAIHAPSASPVRQSPPQP